MSRGCECDVRSLRAVAHTLACVLQVCVWQKWQKAEASPYHVVDVGVLIVHGRLNPRVLAMHVVGREARQADGDVLGASLGKHPSDALALREVHSFPSDNLDGGSVGVLDVHLTLGDEDPLVELRCLPRLGPSSLSLDVGDGDTRLSVI